MEAKTCYYSVKSINCLKQRQTFMAPAMRHPVLLRRIVHEHTGAADGAGCIFTDATHGLRLLRALEAETRHAWIEADR